MSLNTVAELKQHFGKLLVPEVKQRVTIGEAHAAGEDVFTYSPDSDSAKMFDEVVTVLISRGGGK